jgi:hypothetical protein
MWKKSEQVQMVLGMSSDVNLIRNTLHIITNIITNTNAKLIMNTLQTPVFLLHTCLEKRMQAVQENTVHYSVGDFLIMHSIPLSLSRWIQMPVIYLLTT